MSQQNIVATDLELLDSNFDSCRAAGIVKKTQRMTRQARNEAKAIALASQKENKANLLILPHGPLDPAIEKRESAIRQRGKVRRISKKTPKKTAAAKAKAAIIRRMQHVRVRREMEKETEQMRREQEKEAERVAAYIKVRNENFAAERAALVAAKEAEPPAKVTFVDHIDSIKELVDEVASLPNPALYLDAEGISLSRDGEMVFLQLWIDTNVGPHTYVIDTWSLGTDATFHTAGTRHPEMSFKMLLEDPAVPKLFWDCRMDSKALYHQHHISLAGVLDVQLLEVASRPVGISLYYLYGYGKAVSADAGLDNYDKWKMSRVKSAKSLFIPNFGGSWDMLTKRPLDPRLFDYCSGDVLYMARLFEKYSRDLLAKYQRITADPTGMLQLTQPSDFFECHWYKWANKAVEESAERVRRSQQEGWDRSVEEMTRSPWWNEPRTAYYIWEDD